LFKTDREI